MLYLINGINCENGNGGNISICVRKSTVLLSHSEKSKLLSGATHGIRITYPTKEA